MNLNEPKVFRFIWSKFCFYFQSFDDSSVDLCETIQQETPKQNKRKHPSSSSSSDPMNPPMSTVVLQGMKEAIKKINEPKKVDDEFTVFGNYIASELKAIGNVDIANKIKRKLSRLLLDSLDELDAMATYTIDDPNAHILNLQRPQDTIYTIVDLQQATNQQNPPNTD